ncbi:hypothetical protein [Maribacter sp. MAR_2009_72]|uniref:hypothetical protein n=1 Tax=Maribacter sp. MAR_2009_72 TaxID=1250050 RepID=UPI001199E1EC|nr:hypothetical protein [Maribacter sp. MAR_2009_72]TVZ14468.1 hypothetical protein JM81_0672 [Maribacter sp. MAR_2009_72]
MMPQNYSEFNSTLQLSDPPKDWPDALKAMWYDAQENWEAAHDIAQELHSKLGSWMHAYLHRKEGDRFNSGYWYRLAGRTYPDISLDVELQKIVEFILEGNG